MKVLLQDPFASFGAVSRIGLLQGFVFTSNKSRIHT